MIGGGVEEAIVTAVTRAVDAALEQHQRPIQRLAYKVSEAAEAIGTSADTVYGLIRSGELPARKCGPNGQLMVSHQHLADFVNQADAA